ncbi:MULTISPECIES: cell division protein ZapE [unclassified Salinibacterium]|uniref:cell division protein ZapE n=1 Tax=unclassified Salinibacterium TaxID=2632331 RepID=UPI0018CF2751|nr:MULTISPECIES: cell division protein ZapE [unclassified Salinibacterium]MBH0054101.1 cell division protein ZapE [Salinibacterium sp. SWN139]MBH0083387.1 cell division protein ZapE [Salinibacterium sp. SWN167]
MSATAPTTPERLVDRIPSLTGAQMLAELVPPRQFTGATLESYRPDRDYPSQGAAVAAMRHFLTSAQKAKLFSRKKIPVAKPGVYLDGGFGVGKTHLLAALWHQTAGRKYFGTFIEYTALVGAVGYAPAVQLLKGATLVCIDEFELDDPGDTRLISRLLSELVASGTKIAATSNTPPNALGEGRFAAQDFMREIDSLAAKFETIRIDGLDYRRRDTGAHAVAVDDAAAAISAVSGVVTLDSFDGVLKHLAGVHPSRYVKLIEGIDAIALTGVHEFTNQTDALRFVAFVDRLYDAQIPVYAEGTPLDAVFPEDMLNGGYSKKYLRAVSRLIALTSNNA